jgi:hypothetical protein
MVGKRRDCDESLSRDFSHIFFLFNACILRMYPSILSFETINKLELFFQCGITRPQDVGRHLSLRYCKFCKPFCIFNCSAWERAPWRRVTEKSHLFHSKRRSGKTRNRTRATCVAGSGDNRSAIHYVSQQQCSMMHSIFSKREKLSTWRLL